MNTINFAGDFKYLLYLSLKKYACYLLIISYLFCKLYTVAWLSIAALHAVPKQWLKTTTISLYLTILWVRNSSRTPLSDSSISRGVLMDIVLQEGDGDSWACLGPGLSSVVPSQWPTTPSVSREQDKLHSLNDLVL